MTVPEMNAQQTKKWTAVGLGTVLAAGAVGCATPDPVADPAVAPLSPRIIALVDENRRYPDWRNFPRQGTRPPDAAEVAVQVAALDTGSARTAADVAAIDWTLEDPEGFARRIAEDIASRPVAPATLQTREAVEAFARDLLDRGRAPPPVPRR
ncbi:hypothetical protein [Brevundimonas sp.]|uniref:hypothetical protein n=1 Tax=Brevundimonas sp. TaxID=1871086 RepID=UPI003AF7732B